MSVNSVLHFFYIFCVYLCVYLWLCDTLNLFLLLFVVFFFKQKTAYEMRISDWSSDVCSSDLNHIYAAVDYIARYGAPQTIEDMDRHHLIVYGEEIGRASCRERVCQYV